MSLGTPWGLVRYYWVAAKLVLAVLATAVLVGHLPSLSRAVALAATTAVPPQERLHLVVHALGGGLVLLVTIGLSVFKPWGMTSYGLRRARTELDAAQETADPLLLRYALTAGAVLILIVVLLTHLGRSGHFSH